MNYVVPLWTPDTNATTQPCSFGYPVSCAAPAGGRKDRHMAMFFGHTH